ncbi:MAG: DUF3147 family protein [Sedimentisphaerales bacterium]|nr:DUF3147 family protein [Sedimentisphaerales bacterium]
MQFTIKLLITLAIIIVSTQLARVRPSLAGLIAVMPLTGLLVMLWVYTDCGGDPVRMTRYVRGAVWGIVPALLFFGACLLGFRWRWSLAGTLGLGFAVWLAAAAVHQILLSRSG